MVAFGRICYAEVPDLKEIFWEEDEGSMGLGGGGSGDGKGGEREGGVWEGELERAGGESFLSLFQTRLEEI